MDCLDTYNFYNLFKVIMEEKKIAFVNNQHQEAGVPNSKSKDLPIASNLETKHNDGKPPLDYRLDLKSN